MTHAQLWYRSVIDVLIVRWGDDEPAYELGGPGAVTPQLRDDGTCAGIRVRDFSVEWPTVNRSQIAALTSPELLALVDARFAALSPAPSCLGLIGEDLDAALAAGFDDVLDVA